MGTVTEGSTRGLALHLATDAPCVLLLKEGELVEVISCYSLLRGEGENVLV